MNCLVIIDKGHYKDTPGKRTPMLPDGGHIKEYQFNGPTGDILARKLIAQGIEVVHTNTTQVDLALAVRCNVANKAMASFLSKHPKGKVLLVSIHYNAHVATWDGSSASGIEVFSRHKTATNQALYDESLRFATIMYNHIVQGTPQLKRGVKQGNLAMVRDVNMPAVLCEFGFMDDPAEAVRMIDPAYQEECAEEMLRGCMDTLGLIPKDLEPVWKHTLRLKTNSPEKWIAFVEEMKDHPMGKWLPELITRLGGK